MIVKKQIEWTRLEKMMAWIAGLFVAAALLWLCLPSSLFIKVISTTVKGGHVTFVRELPFGPVHGRWHSEIVMLDGSDLECPSSAGGNPWRRAYYQKKKSNTVVYRLGSWANDCLRAGAPYYLRDVRQVLLFNLIPLRPSETYTEVLDGKMPTRGLSLGSAYISPAVQEF